MSVLIKIKLLVPKFLAILSILVMCINTKINGLDSYFPAIDLMVIYYWCIYRPQLLGNGFVFFIGFFKDLLMGLPFGVNAFTNMALRMLIVHKGHNFKPKFNFLWQGFAIILSISIALKWLMFSFVTGKWVSLENAFVYFVVSVLLYPILHSLFNYIYTGLPRKFLNA